MKDNSIRYLVWHNPRNAVFDSTQQIIEDEAYKSLHWQARHDVEDILNYYEGDIMHDFVWRAAIDYFKKRSYNKIKQ
jgi:hypothetical protein